MKMRWWMPLVAVPVGLVVVLSLASMAGADVGAGLQRLTKRLHTRFHGSSLRMDDGEHSLYVTWVSREVQEARVDDKPIPTDWVTLDDGVVFVHGALDAEGFPLFEEVAFAPDAQLRLLPADSLQRLGLRLAAEPEADGSLRLRPEQVHRRGYAELVDGPALQAGVQPGDVLLAVAGTRPGTRETLREALRARPADEPLPLLVRRAGVEQELVLRPLALTADNFWQIEVQEIEQRGAVASEAQGTDTSR
jgi:membrane-associated protease RseP (regulator of RpoE activity)